MTYAASRVRTQAVGRSLAALAHSLGVPELRGALLIVIISVVTLCGSIYLILGTNLGARLGFLVALTGLAGWMALMGLIWMIYGIGLKGPEPSWDAVPGRTVLQDPNALYQAGVLPQRPEVPEDATSSEQAAVVATSFDEAGWTVVPEEAPAFGQASAAAGDVHRGDGRLRGR